MDKLTLSTYLSRQNKLRKILNNKNLDAALIIKPENTYYLTSFKGSLAYLLVFKDNNISSILFTDNRYYESAKKDSQACDTFLVTENGLKSIGTKLNDFEVKSLAIEADFMTISFVDILNKDLRQVELINQSNLIEKIRILKESGEVELIKTAISISEKTLEKIVQIIKPGIDEKEIATELDYQIKKFGGDASGFETIVASGENSAIPHSKVSDRKIQKGDLVKIDFGAVKDGYCSDITRTFVIGQAEKWQKKIHRAAVKSSKIAFEIIKPEIKFSLVDQGVRDYLEGEGLEEYFIHNLGHGVGLEVHELPVLRKDSQDTAKSGMVFTIEPGIYLQGKGGVRNEDMVHLTNQGPEKLSTFSDELIEL